MTLENKILFLLLGKTYFSAVFSLFSLFYCTCNCFSYFCKVIYNFLYFILLFQIKIAHLADGNRLDVYRSSRCPSYGFQLVIRLLLLVHTSTTVQRGLKIFSYRPTKQHQTLTILVPFHIRFQKIFTPQPTSKIHAQESCMSKICVLIDTY